MSPRTTPRVPLCTATSEPPGSQPVPHGTAPPREPSCRPPPRPHPAMWDPSLAAKRHAHAQVAVSGPRGRAASRACHGRSLRSPGGCCQEVSFGLFPAGRALLQIRSAHRDPLCRGGFAGGDLTRAACPGCRGSGPSDPPPRGRSGVRERVPDAPSEPEAGLAHRGCCRAGCPQFRDVGAAQRRRRVGFAVEFLGSVPLRSHPRRPRGADSCVCPDRAQAARRGRCGWARSGCRADWRQVSRMPSVRAAL